jgi:alginate O-acetyltransferase complex protein AlgI
MFFNSIEFAVFLPLVFFLYWFLGRNSKSWQNGVLIISSYYFYGCWDWRFLFLLLFSTGLDYFTALKIHQGKEYKTRKFWLWLSIIINLGFLGLFKYYDFFAKEMQQLLSRIGFETAPMLLQLILPVGISFYTFHGLSYVIDIYYKRIVPEKNFVDYSLFVCYFPLLVAGPIERATHLLPQVKVKRTFDAKMAIAGVQQIIWGLFKKIVIADSCAEYANEIFGHYETANSLSLLLGAVYFAFQIYGDFSGYSDIALGTSKLFGIELLQNFKYPYFSRDIAEFWRRWHISLSSWFKDYLYIPLGGSKGGTRIRVRNTFIIFLVSGFWHGANWTFIVWGLLNALFIMPSIIYQTNRNNIEIVAKDKLLPSVKELLQMLITFALTCFAWIFFRSKDMSSAIGYIKNIFLHKGFEIESLGNERKNFELMILLFFFISVEWFYRNQTEPLSGRYTYLKTAFCFLLLLMLGVYTDYKEFIYFQF